MPKLFPHDVIEAINKAEVAFAKVLKRDGPIVCEREWKRLYNVPFSTHDKFFSSMRGSLAECVTYDFGHLAPDDAHIEFAKMLFEHNDFTEYTSTAIVIDSKNRDYRYLHLVEPGHEKGVIFSLLSVDDNGEVVPVGTFIDAYLEEFKSAEARGHLKHRYFVDKGGDLGVTASGAVRVSTNEMVRFDKGEEGFLTVMAHHFCHTMGLLAMLGCKEVERITVPAPAKLNKRRLSNHKPPITERTEIKVNLTSKALQVEYLTDDTPEGYYGRGTPKRPHWRRPHPHRLPKSGIIKLYPPTWVNWDEDSGLPRPSIKGYRFR